MGYDDNYDSSKGEYWSLSSMNSTEKMIYICYNGLDSFKHNWTCIHWTENIQTNEIRHITRVLRQAG